MPEGKGEGDLPDFPLVMFYARGHNRVGQLRGTGVATQGHVARGQHYRRSLVGLFAWDYSRGTKLRGLCGQAQHKKQEG